MKQILLSIIVAIVIATPSMAADKIVMAIMDFEASDVPRSDAVKVSELIRTELVNISDYIIVERAQMDKILTQREQVLQAGCTNVTCAVQIGKLLSARKILVGSVMRIGNSITIAGRVIDVQKGINEFGEKVVVQSRDDLVYGVEQFCEKLTARITGKPAEKKNAATVNSNIKYYSYTYTTYEAVSDPTGWISLGSFLVGGIICAGGAMYYKNNTFSLQGQIDGSSFMLAGTGGWNDPAMTLYFYLDIQNKKKTIRDAQRTRNTVCYVGAGFGGFAAIMFITFIGRYVHYNVAVNSTPEPGHVALYLPVSDIDISDKLCKNNLNFKLGLSAAW